MNKIAGWPAVRSFNFDVNGQGSIRTWWKAMFTIPLIIIIILTFIYFVFPLIYHDKPISTNIDIVQLRPAFEYYSNDTKPEQMILGSKVFSWLYKKISPEYGFVPKKVNVTNFMDNFGI